MNSPTVRWNPLSALRNAVERGTATILTAIEEAKEQILSELSSDIAAVKQAVAGASTRLSTQIAALEAKIASGGVTVQDLQDLKDLATALADPTFAEPVPPKPAGS